VAVLISGWALNIKYLPTLKSELDEFIKQLSEAQSGFLSGLGQEASGGHSGDGIRFKDKENIIFEDHIGSAVTGTE
jgi:hypothetical protein